MNDDVPANTHGASSDGRELVVPPFGRRTLFAGAGAILAGVTGLRYLIEENEAFHRAGVFVTRAASYEDNLADIIRRGLAELGLRPAWARGKSVLLKPNMVEPTKEAPHASTHPAVVRAAVEVFRSWGARDVFVAEGQGHHRDPDFMLEQSGIGTMLTQERIQFVDLNYDDIYKTYNNRGSTGLRQLCLPVTLRRADLIVSMPKLKTHHWVGMTCAMKNLFGVMPGVCYGWPKNVLHRAGISESILDINRAVGAHLAIVDGIIAMEGDGPILGDPRRAGILAMGTNLTAVDATMARIMEIDPGTIPYLASASGRLGPIAERHIQQRGELLATVAQRFARHVSWDRTRGAKTPEGLR
jgi:uncharacterized protein (DUF362 family)